jgi:hypothetical protein
LLYCLLFYCWRTKGIVVVGEQKKCCCPFYCCESIQSVSQVDPLHSPMKSFCVPEWIPHALSSSIQRRIILPGCQMTIQLETTMKPQNKDSNQYYIESLRCQDTLLIAYSIGDLSNNIKPTEGLNVEQHSLTIS